MLSIIGVGLDPEDLSLRALRVIGASDVVYLEKYTSIIMNEHKIEEIINKKVSAVYREDLEDVNEPRIIREAQKMSVVLLVVGTPLFATTHTELLIRCKELGVPTEVLHNASIQNVMGCCGFSSYRFGETVSVPFFTETWRPCDFFLHIVRNFTNNLHTLCLLDIKINEPTLETLMGKEDKRYTRFMRINEALEQIEEAAKNHKIEMFDGVEIIAVERFGQKDERFSYGTFKELKNKTYGDPLHSIIIPSLKNSRMERENIERFFR